MIIRAMTYLLLLLMSLQTSADIADAHSAHQSGTEHLSFEDHHHPDDQDLGLSLSEFSHDQENDCHHCCHCHSNFCPVILISMGSIKLFKTTSPIPDYSNNSVTDPFEAFLRPPKA